MATMANGRVSPELESVQIRRPNILSGPDLGPNYLQRLSADYISKQSVKVHVRMVFER